MTADMMEVEKVMSFLRLNSYRRNVFNMTASCLGEDTRACSDRLPEEHPHGVFCCSCYLYDFICC